MGYSRFARRYSGSHVCFLFLRVLRCFNSPGSLYRCYVFTPEYRPLRRWVSPFGHPRFVTLSRQLTVAFRSQTRPSSVVDAKASTVGPLYLGRTKMLVLAMQFSRGFFGQANLARSATRPSPKARAMKERPFRTEQRTERSSSARSAGGNIDLRPLNQPRGPN